MMYWQIFCIFFILQNAVEELSSYKLQQRHGNRVPRSNKKVGCGMPINKTGVFKCRDVLPHLHEDHKNTCDSYPSEPLDVSTKFTFNVTTKKLSLQIRWNPPDYGTGDMWGYDIHLDGSHCIQIIGNVLNPQNFTYPGLDFQKHKYHVTISSLPRKDEKFHNSWDEYVTPPDICTTYKKYGIQQLPFECQSVENLRVLQPCVSGVNESVLVAFDQPQWMDYLDIELKILKVGCNQKLHQKILKKVEITNTTTHLFEGLKGNCTYHLTANMWRKVDDEYDGSPASKIDFRCKELTNTPKPSLVAARAKESSSNLVLYLMPAATCIVLSAVIAYLSLRCWRMKKQRQQQVFGLRNHNATNEQAIEPLPSQPMVMILWCHGCKDLENFVLLLASLLQANGFDVKLDLLENNVVAEQGGLAKYLVRGEDDADYVIVVCTENPDNSFNFILDIIRNKIMDRECKARYIPVHIQQEVAKVVPPCLRGNAYRVPEKVEEIIQRMYKVPVYTLSEQPFVNTMCLDQTCMESLKKAATSFLKPKHNDCDSANCVKGVAPDERAVETNSINSFSSDESVLVSLSPRYHQLSTSQDSFLACGLDKEVDLHMHIMGQNC
eukprot:Seg1430.19 transcript_id=Seg1430.19/GoldUCD/mRNA.D3Y31 product="hypothetical protein" protein_id=Seg1430.19/GoldUCD/D3Y31